MNQIGQTITASMDGGFNESDHPRGEGGKFGPGGGSVPSSKSKITVISETLGTTGATTELRKAAMQHAETHLIGKSFKNARTGADIEVTRQGIKHSLAGANEAEIRLLPHLPEILKNAEYVEQIRDRKNRPDIKAAHLYRAKVELSGKTETVGVVVRETHDGHKHYDHFLTKSDPARTSGAASDGKLGAPASAGSEWILQAFLRKYNAMDTARQPDTNGWVEIKGNPITKTGVFEYLGSSMMPELEPNKIYKVYRPPEALKNEATINSFKLLPWIDDHTMLSEAKGNTSTDEVGIKGVTGEECYFDAPYLRINLKIFSEELALLIRSGKKELSAGYTCRYEMAAGVTPDGQQYDAIQTNIRGNHLALVEEGRAGSDVSVLDGKCFFTIDAKDKTMPPDMTQVHALLTQLMALFSPAAKADGDDAPPATPQGDADPKNPAATPENPANKPGDGIDADPSASGDPERAEAKDGDDEDEDEAMDTAIATLKSQRDRAPKAQRTAMDAAIAVFETKRTNKRNAMDARVRNLESQIAKLAKPAAHTAMDAAVVEKAINAKASLVRQLAPVVGAFDAADMSLSQVAEYGCTKLGLKPAKGQELTAMDAYFAGRQNKPVVVVQAQDAGDTAALENFLTGGK